MIIKRFDQEQFQTELEMEVSRYAFDENECSPIGKAFNRGLETAFHAAQFIVSHMLTEQIKADVERDRNERCALGYAEIE